MSPVIFKRKSQHLSLRFNLKCLPFHLVSFYVIRPPLAENPILVPPPPVSMAAAAAAATTAANSPEKPITKDAATAVDPKKAEQRDKQTDPNRIKTTEKATNAQGFFLEWRFFSVCCSFLFTSPGPRPQGTAATATCLAHPSLPLFFPAFSFLTSH